MRLLRCHEQLSDIQNSVVSIGNFDGVHLGHQRLIQQTKSIAERHNTQAIIFTFDPSPSEILRADTAPHALTTMTMRARLIEREGIDTIVAYPTDSTFLAMSPEVFFEEIILKQLRALALVEGPNFCFGNRRAGNIDTLETLTRPCNVELHVVEPYLHDNQVISSSWIRQRLHAGEIQQANFGLNRPYGLEGIVCRGSERGRSIGFPTANLSQVKTLVPADGVYIASAKVEKDVFPAAVNIGPNPTFQEYQQKIEAHLVGFEGNLYNLPLFLELHERLRDTRSFENPDALVRQLEADVAAVNRWFENPAL